MKWASLGQLGAVLVMSVAALGCSSNDTKGGGATDTTPPATNVVTTENFGMTHTGDGTFYATANGAGACLYDVTTDIHIAALNASDWAKSAWCGSCVCAIASGTSAPPATAPAPTAAPIKNARRASSCFFMLMPPCVF